MSGNTGIIEYFLELLVIHRRTLQDI